MDDDFPVLDVLVVVHYDNLNDGQLAASPECAYVHSAVDERINTYLAAGKPVYNISTYDEPPTREGVTNVPKMAIGVQLGLDTQLGYLLAEMDRNDDLDERNVEVVGVSWFACVAKARAQLEFGGADVQVNYASTDALPIAHACNEYPGFAPTLTRGRELPRFSVNTLRQYRVFVASHGI